jgi:hypothetical protein
MADSTTTDNELDALAFRLFTERIGLPLPNSGDVS